MKKKVRVRNVTAKRRFRYVWPILVIIAASAILALGQQYIFPQVKAPEKPEENISDNTQIPESSVTYNFSTLSYVFSSRGFRVSNGGEIVATSTIPVEGNILRVSGENVQVYDFANKFTVDSFADTISADGYTIGGNNVNWIDEPHIYKSGSSLFVYVGTNGKIIEILNTKLDRVVGGDEIYCTARGSVCIQTYAPVCGWFGPEIKCEKYPCAKLFSNSCFACSDETVAYYTPGPCPE